MNPRSMDDGDCRPTPCVSSSTISVATERAQSLHIPDDFLRKGLVKPTLVCLDSGALNR